MAPPPPPPPPPPPGCFPFTRSKSGRSNDDDEKPNSRSRPPPLSRSNTVSSTSTLTSRPEKLSFTSDSIIWENIPVDNTTRPSPPRRFGSGSSKGKGKGKGKEQEQEQEKQASVNDKESGKVSPVISPVPSRNSSQRTVPRVLVGSPAASPSPSRSNSNSNKSKNFFTSLSFSKANSSSDTLVGSAFERKVADAQVPFQPRVDTGPKIEEIRKLMQKEKIDYYIVPSTDAHGSEYIAPCDKRREWLTGFTGSAGTAVISSTHAYLFTDSRYYIQAARELDTNWTLQKVGWEGKKDWYDWLIDRAKGVKVGVDSRLISYALAERLNKAFVKRGSHLVYPWQNLVDLVWKERPLRPKDPVYVQPMEFAGEDAVSKLTSVREWITRSAPETAKYSANPPPASDLPVAAFIHNLADIAWTLNLRGSDIPYNPVFQAYLFVSFDNAILFVDSEKVAEEVRTYLTENGVSMKEYSDVWPFLRTKEWGDGKVLITDDVPFTVPRSLTSIRYHIVPPYISKLKSVKNRIELDGMVQAYLRDGAAMVQWYAWLDEKIAHGYEITEYEASYRLDVFRSEMQYYQGPAYESIVATGPNAALPHYIPPRHNSRVIDRSTPFLTDSGGQYRDGTCDTTRTVHFGRPTSEQSEAYTRVLQGHIALDSAVFPEGTTGTQLDILARKALWKDGLNYLHGSGHGIGCFLNVHEEPYFGKDMVFEPGQVLSNEPGFYREGEFGVRIESVMVVKRIKTKYEFQGDIWLGFERLTQVPIQVKMIKAPLLSKEERTWVRNHNEEVRKNLEPLLSKDKRALRWLRKECQPGFRSETSVSGVSIEWD